MQFTQLKSLMRTSSSTQMRQVKTKKIVQSKTSQRGQRSFYKSKIGLIDYFHKQKHLEGYSRIPHKSKRDANSIIRFFALKYDECRQGFYFVFIINTSIYFLVSIFTPISYTPAEYWLRWGWDPDKDHMQTIPRITHSSD